MKRELISFAMTAALAWVALVDTAAAEDGYGSVTGQFVLDGDIPELKPLETKGKDAPTCPADNVPDDSLVVDSASKGIANVFVFVRTKPKKIHPDLTASKEKAISFDQKNCRFIPHAMLVRTDQEVLVKSSDGVSHNTHTNPVNNQGENFFVQANDQKGRPVSFKGSERLPVLVNCDIHSWMKAYWLVLDHPYAAVTDKDGKFTIDKLPAGDLEFRVWHERKGWVSAAAGIKQGFKATVKSDGATNIGTVKVPVADLMKK
jgi:hypothetical protein